MDRIGKETELKKGGAGMDRIGKETELKRVELEWTGSVKKLN